MKQLIYYLDALVTKYHISVTNASIWRLLHRKIQQNNVQLIAKGRTIPRKKSEFKI